MKKIIRATAYFPFNMGLHIIVLQICARFAILHIPLMGAWIATGFRHIIRIYSSCELSPLAKIALSVKFPHPTGIVIGDGVVVREHVAIWQHVTLGSHGKPDLPYGYPTIEARVRIFCNSSVLGRVTVGAESTVGAHSLVLSDVPHGATVVGVPARVTHSEP